MLEALFQSATQQVLSKYNTQLQQINAVGKKLETLTDDELQNLTQNLKQRLENGDSQDSIINEAFALVREASDRVLGLHFPLTSHSYCFEFLMLSVCL